jgi:hypothetical protein
MLSLLYHLERCVTEIFQFPRLQKFLTCILDHAFLLNCALQQQLLFGIPEAAIAAQLLLLFWVSLDGSSGIHPFFEEFDFFYEAVLTNFPESVFNIEFSGTFGGTLGKFGVSWWIVGGWKWVG